MSLESGAVQDYLNCGLDSFGLKIHGVIHNNSCQEESNANENESIFSNEDDNDEHDHEDVYVFANGA